jgi:hypothetical protein
MACTIASAWPSSSSAVLQRRCERQHQCVLLGLLLAGGTQLHQRREAEPGS